MGEDEEDVMVSSSIPQQDIRGEQVADDDEIMEEKSNESEDKKEDISFEEAKNSTEKLYDISTLCRDCLFIEASEQISNLIVKPKIILNHKCQKFCQQNPNCAAHFLESLSRIASDGYSTRTVDILLGNLLQVLKFLTVCEIVKYMMTSSSKISEKDNFFSFLPELIRYGEENGLHFGDINILKENKYWLRVVTTYIHNGDKILPLYNAAELLFLIHQKSPEVFTILPHKLRMLIPPFIEGGEDYLSIIQNVVQRIITEIQKEKNLKILTKRSH